MKSIPSLLLCLHLCACTYSVTMVHTEGEATDVVDETTENTPSLSVEPKMPGMI